jgi:diguanylate cyclase (GGDEF)-like protein/PAS domain S-box-containing protein
MHEYRQIFETINLGLVTLDRDLKVTGWNRWMELHSGINAADVMGCQVCETFPDLSRSSFLRIVKGVLTFGNYASYSQKLHKFLFPMKNPHGSHGQLPQMQQNCTVGPLRNEQREIVGVYITVQDVTDFVIYEEKLATMAKTDGLTGIYNRRYLDQRLQEELERSRRHGNSVSILLLDIDHFKKINDTYGHLSGDYALRGFAAELRKNLRSIDILGRYGGEEFCCILPETPLGQAHSLAERCRAQIAATPLCCIDRQLTVTASIGVAGQLPDDTADSLIRRADYVLYQAKHLGRNRVCCLTAPREMVDA